MKQVDLSTAAKVIGLEHVDHSLQTHVIPAYPAADDTRKIPVHDVVRQHVLDMIAFNGRNRYTLKARLGVFCVRDEQQTIVTVGNQKAEWLAGIMDQRERHDGPPERIADYLCLASFQDMHSVMIVKHERLVSPHTEVYIHASLEQVLDGLGMIKVFVAHETPGEPGQTEIQPFPQRADRQAGLKEQGSGAGGLDEVGIPFGRARYGCEGDQFAFLSQPADRDRLRCAPRLIRGVISFLP